MRRTSRKRLAQEEALANAFLIVEFAAGIVGNVFAPKIVGSLPPWLGWVGAHPIDIFLITAAGAIVVNSLRQTTLNRARSHNQWSSRLTQAIMDILIPLEALLIFAVGVSGNLIAQDVPGSLPYVGACWLILIMLVARRFIEKAWQKLKNLGKPRAVPPNRMDLLGAMKDRVAKFRLLQLRSRPNVDIGALKGSAIAPCEAPLVEVYRNMPHMPDDPPRRLCIHAWPGGGNTNEMYDLWEALIAEALQDTAKPLPILVDLASWSARTPPLDRWLVEEIVATYGGASEPEARWLVESDNIVLLLDSFDTSPEAHPKKCIERINTYLLQHDQVSVVICRPLKDYDLVFKDLGAFETLDLDSLTDDVIDTAIGARKELREVVDKDERLREAIRIPLLLKVVCSTFDTLGPDDIATSTDEYLTWRSLLFKQYVDTRRTEYIGRIDRYLIDQGHTTITYESDDFIKAISWVAFAMGKRGTFRFEFLDERCLQSDEAKRYFRRLNNTIAPGCTLALMAALSLALVYRTGWVGFLCFWFGVLISSAFALTLPRGDHAIRGTETIARIIWSWDSVTNRIHANLPALIGAGVVIVVTGASTALGVASSFGWSLALETALALTAVLLVIVLLLTTTIAIQPQPTQPQNSQGPYANIWLSVRTAIVVLLVVTTIGAICFGLVPAELIHLMPLNLLDFVSAAGDWRPIGIAFGLGAIPFVLGATLQYGGTAVVRHIFLRCALAKFKIVPPQIVECLTEATRLTFLRRVGGGYRFIHPLLQEYFADEWQRSHPDQGLGGAVALQLPTPVPAQPVGA